jgi:hypothetical protein
MFTRKFGVEIETSSCNDWADREDCMDWSAKPDYSVSGLEFVSEILSGYSGINAIREICDYAEEHDWEVDEDCGLHVHFDMREESNDSLKAIALAYKLTYEVWIKFVDRSRWDNRYCKQHSAKCSDIYGARDFEDFARNQTRYEWFNFEAYSKHSTFEVRLHEGTLDGRRICNWVKAHAVFIDWASDAGWAKVRNTLLCMDTNDKMDFIAQLWYKAGYADVAEYYQDMVCV